MAQLKILKHGFHNIVIKCVCKGLLEEEMQQKSLIQYESIMLFIAYSYFLE